MLIPLILSDKTLYKGLALDKEDDEVFVTYHRRFGLTLRKWLQLAPE